MNLPTLRDEAVHGTYCPKMCTFACPVTAATGREDVKPWGLHVAVAGVLSGSRVPDASAWHDLRGCSGCHACREACVWDLSLPAEVEAARRVVVQAGGAPTIDVPAPPEPPAVREDADVAIVGGCRDDGASLAALDRLLERIGVRATFVAPDACCGALLSDLGRDGGGITLPAGVPVVVSDPHCRAAIPQAQDLPTYLAGLDLPPVTTPVVWHDPCVLARDAGVLDAPRRLLTVVEPERTGSATACSGAGLGFDLISPDEAALVAARRREQLSAAGDHPIVTACPRAARLLGARDLATFLEEQHR